MTKNMHNHPPQNIKQLATTWQLTNLQPVTNLSVNYVLTGKMGHTDIVLKIINDQAAFTQEVAALQAFAGYGCPEILHQNPELGALLLRRIMPGTTLRNYFPHADEASITIAARVMQKLHQAPLPQNHNFPSVTTWLAALDDDWHLPTHHLDRARELSQQLLATNPAHEVLLHGDLHHDNIIMCSDKAWIALDPKGVVGDPAYEVGAFIRNPKPELLNCPDLSDLLRQRITLFAAALGCDAQRIHHWTYVQAILAACWNIEEGHDPAYFLHVAQLLRKD